MLARQSPAAGRQPPAAEPVPVAAAGAAREANAPAPAIAEQPERAAPAAPWPDGPARRGSGGTWRERLLRAGEAIFGAAWPAILDRVVHLRVSTLLALLMAGVITIVLFLTYLKLPPQENALVSNFLESSPRPAGGEAEGGPAAGPRLVDPAALPAAPGPSGGARQVLVRPVPLWSPGAGGVEGEAGSPQRATEPEIRNVEPAVPPAGGEGTAPGETATANGAAAPEGGDAPAAAPRSPHLYLIQVKAKESGEEAERILEYLGLLGFGDPRVEHKGDRHADGTKLYTVFVGSFEEEKQARRECERLRRETRRRPYRDREDFFADALVITRARR
jgi:hypothetical protein